MGPSHVMICKWNASWKVLSRDVHSFNTSLWWELNSLIWPGRRKYFYYHKKTNCHIAKSHIYSTCYSVILRSLRVFSTKVLLAIVKIPIPDYFQIYKCKTIQKQKYSATPTQEHQFLLSIIYEKIQRFIISFFKTVNC